MTLGWNKIRKYKNTVLADSEADYSEDKHRIADNVLRILDVSVKGINIDDSRENKKDVRIKGGKY